MKKVTRQQNSGLMKGPHLSSCPICSSVPETASAFFPPSEALWVQSPSCGRVRNFGSPFWALSTAGRKEQERMPRVKRESRAGPPGVPAGDRGREGAVEPLCRGDSRFRAQHRHGSAGSRAEIWGSHAERQGLLPSTVTEHVTHASPGGLSAGLRAAAQQVSACDLGGALQVPPKPVLSCHPPAY